MQSIKFDLSRMTETQIRSLSATLEIKAAKRNGYAWYRESINGRWANDRFLYVYGNAIAYGICPYKYARMDLEDKTQEFIDIWK